MRAYFDERPVEVACDILGVGEDAARDQMRVFEAAGYIERSELARAADDYGPRRLLARRPLTVTVSAMHATPTLRGGTVATTP